MNVNNCFQGRRKKTGRSDLKKFILNITKKQIIIVAIILIFCILIAFLNIPIRIQKIIYKKDYEEYVQKYSQQYNVDENLVYALIKAESNFNANAQSSKGAIGLMQLMETTAQDVCKRMDLNISNNELKEKLLEPEININIGTKYLSILIQQYGNVEIAITAYNAGIGTVDNWIEKDIIKADGSNVEKIPYKETNNYVRKILRDYKIYTNLEQKVFL